MVKAETSGIDSRAVVGCGQTVLDQRIVIVHPKSMKRCSPSEIGEIWVKGPNVAQGYWNRPDETEATFRAYLADTGEGPFLRTGDLGFTQDGELFVTGRIKDLIIIRGRNHYPQDIELTVETSHPTLRPGGSVAFSVDVVDEERLVVVAEVERRHYRNLDVDAVISVIRGALSEAHEVQVYAVVFIRPGALPKTSSGKVQRHVCRTLFMEKAFDVVGEWQESIMQQTDSLADVLMPPHTPESIQRWLVSQLAPRLGVETGEINVTQPITRYGLDSLLAIHLMQQIETHLGVTLPMVSFFENCSISQIADRVNEHLTTPSHTLETRLTPAQTPSAEAPLSYGQRALWFLYRLAPESPAYNIARAVRIRSPLSIPTLRRAFQTLVDRHASLRTTFTISHGEPVQRVREHEEVCFVERDASTWNEPALNAVLIEAAHCPFDLEKGSLLRMGLFTRSADDHVLLLVVHHIVADFWSLEVLIHELGVLYPAEKTDPPVSLPPPALQYTDYVRWQSDMLARPEGERLWNYWRNQLAGELTVLNLPTDRPRPTVQANHGASYPFKLNEVTTQGLQSLSRGKW